MQQRGELAWASEQVRGDEHLVVEPDDRVVHRRLVQAQLDPVALVERLEVEDRRSDARSQSAVEAFFGVALCDMGAVGVGERDADLAAVSGFSGEQVGQAWVILGQVKESVTQQVEPPGGLGEQSPPCFRGEVCPVRVCLVDLG